MNSLSMYIIVKLDDIRHFFDILDSVFLTIGLILLTVFIIGLVLYSIAEGCRIEEQKPEKEREHPYSNKYGYFSSMDMRDIYGTAVLLKKYFKYGIHIIVLSIIFLMAKTAIPSTKQMAAILIIPPITNNQCMSEMPNHIAEIAAEWMEELKPKKILKEVKNVSKNIVKKTK